MLKNFRAPYEAESKQNCDKDSFFLFDSISAVLFDCGYVLRTMTLVLFQALLEKGIFMEWNNGYERALFEAEQRKLARWYRKEGMSEQQIREIYEYDLGVFRERRTHECHRCDLPLIDDSFAEEEGGVNFKEPAYEYQMDIESVEDWIDSMDSEWLIRILKGMTPNDQLILKLAFYDGYNGVEIARIVNRSYKKIRTRLAILKNRIRKGREM